MFTKILYSVMGGVVKAQIYINRHIVAANKKESKVTGKIVDRPAISINTYKGSTYTKRVELAEGIVLVQDGFNPRCSGATIWIEIDDLGKIKVM